MDVYRIGTLLEMVREMAYQLAVDGKLVKVCVQQSMGQGVFQVHTSADAITVSQETHLHFFTCCLHLCGKHCLCMLVCMHAMYFDHATNTTCMRGLLPP